MRTKADRMRLRMRRRHFHNAAMKGIALLAACAAPPSPETGPLPTSPTTPSRRSTLLEQVPAEVRYQRTPIPDAQNAFPLWERAGKTFVALDAPDAEALIDSALDETRGLPADPEGGRINVWVERNRECLAHFDAGTKRGRCQFPEIDGFDTELPYLANMKNISTLKAALAKTQAAGGDWESACNTLLAQLRAGEMIALGEGGLIHYLVGIAVQRICLDGLAWLAIQERVPLSVLAKTCAALASNPRARDALALALSVELCAVCVPTVEHAEQHLGSLLNGGSPRDLKNDEVRQSLLKNVDAIDKAGTVRQLGAYYARMAANARASWKGRTRHDLYREAEADWRAGIQSAVILHLGGFIAELLYHRWVLGEWMSRQEKAEFKDLWSVKMKRDIVRPFNVVGKAMVSLLLVPDESLCRTAAEAIAEREALRTRVAIRLFHGSRGRYPDSLRELVDAKILPSLPTDPFSDEPFRYSRDRGLLWSVGPDGRDDAGEGAGTGRRWEGKDGVWRFRPQ